MNGGDTLKYNYEDENYVYYLAGQNLKRLRKAAGLTQEQLAEKCNYTPGFIGNIESKSYYQSFSFGVIWRIALILKVDAREFLAPLEEDE